MDTCIAKVQKFVLNASRLFKDIFAS